MKRSLLIAATVLAACGSSAPQVSKYDQTQTQVPVTPKGTIVGRVLDMSTYLPLGGVSVKVLGTENVTLTTNTDGLFTFADAVVASTYTFVMEKEGYLRFTQASSISGTTGTSPLAGAISTFTAQMYKADGEIRGVVFLPDGKPASNATVMVDQRQDLGGNYESLVSAVTGADGSFKLTGLATRPAGMGHNVSALWFDENNDGNADYGTVTQNVITYPGSVARAFLTYSSVGQRIVSSNIIDGEVGPNDDLQFAFALPLLTSNLTGTAANAYVLTNTTRATTVAVEPTWASNTTLSLKPVGGALKEGDRYSLALSLTNASAGASNTTANFTQTLAFQVRGTTGPITAQVTNLTVTNPNPSFTQGASQFDWNANTFKLTWDGVTGAAGYLVYAKDTTLNPNFVLIPTAINTLAPRMSLNVSLPASFDPNPNDGTTQSLSMNNKVTFTVVPVDVMGNFSPLGSAPTVQVSDNKPPTTTSTAPQVVSPVDPNTNAVDAINDDAVASTIQLRVSYSEPMDPLTFPTFITAGTATQSFVWDSFSSGGYSGVLTLTIAPGADASGPFTIRGGKDMAGNLLVNNDIAGSLTGRKELLTNGGFEDSSGACSLTGWSATQSGGMPAPVTVSNSARTGKCAALLGSAPGTAPQTGTSKLSQDVNVPSVTVASGYYFDVRMGARGVNATSSGGSTTATQVCRVTDTSNSSPPLLSLYNWTNSNASGYSYLPFSTLFGTNTTVRVSCELANATSIAANTALYVDDVSLMLVKPGTI